LLIFILSKLGYYKLGFLWLNPIGAFGVIIFVLVLQPFFGKKQNPAREQG